MLSHLLTTLIDDIDGDTVTLRALLEASGRQGMLLICALSSLPFLIPPSSSPCCTRAWPWCAG